MPAWAWIICGAWTPLALDRALAPGVLLGIAAFGLFLLIPGRTRGPAMALLALAWAGSQVTAGVQDRLPEASLEPRWFSGTVVSLPRRLGETLEFQFQADPTPTGAADASGKILVRWHRNAPTVRAGERWRLHLRLRPPRGRVNFAGPDPERYWFAEQVGALGVVASGGQRLTVNSPARPWLTWRQAARDSVAQLLVGHAGAGLVLALAVADRSALEPGLVDALRITGTGHLLAISGLHVGLVALFALGVCRGLLAPFACWGRGRPLFWAWAPALLAASAYAVLAGLATSTTRALAMLLALALVGMTRRTCAPWRAWCLALAGLTLARPLSVLEAGYWLSFGAVAVLLWVLAPWQGARPGRGAARLVRAQAGICLGLLPLGMEWFQAAGLGGLLVNLAAIPWVSLVTLPLVLAGLAMALLEAPWAEPVLQMAAQSGQWASWCLGWAAAWLDFVRWPTHRPGIILTLLASLSAASLLLPRGVAWRWLPGLALVPALWAPARLPEPGAVRLQLLDTGQGLAALVRTREQVLLYDSGPGVPGQWDLYASVIAPALARGGLARPDRILISHGDLDHAGALVSLRNHHPGVLILANQANRTEGLRGCHDRYRWQRGAARFRVLHPGPFLPYRGNASSCVLGLRAPGGSLLLPGDIDAGTERYLAQTAPGDWDYVVAPHHGSRSSSSADFLDWARPRAVLIAAGVDNRYGFPHREVLDRIARRGTPVWSTAACGGIELELPEGGARRVTSARRVRAAPWRWPAAPDCP